MAYSKLNLANGQKLTAEHLAHVETAISAADAATTANAFTATETTEGVYTLGNHGQVLGLTIGQKLPAAAKTDLEATFPTKLAIQQAGYLTSVPFANPNPGEYTIGANTVQGLTSDAKLPEVAKSDVAGDVEIRSSMIGSAIGRVVDAVKEVLTPRSGTRPVGQGELFLNVRDHGVKGDGTTDDTAAIQALINAQPTTGGVLFFPAGTYRISNLTLPGFVQLVGSSKMYGYGPQGKGITRFVAVTGSTGWMVDSTGSGTAVVGIDFRGLSDGITGSTGGIRSNGSWCRFSEIHFEGFKESALKLETGNACVVDNILAFNCVANRGVTAATGVIDLAGNDHWVTRVEANASLGTTVSSASLYVNAWVIRCTNGFFANCVGEFSDRGYLVTGSKNRFTGMRADRNMGIGWEITGSSNVFAACMAVDNAAAANDTYPAFLTSGQGNAFTACRGSYTAGKLPTYVFEDTVDNSSLSSRNNYDPSCTGNAARAVFSGKGYLGSSFHVPMHPARVTSGATIPVDQSGFQILVYTTASTVTGFTGGHSGQTIRLIPLNSNVTLANGSALRTGTGANLPLVSGVTYEFTNYNGVWYPSSAAPPIIPDANGVFWRVGVAVDGSLTTTTL